MAERRDVVGVGVTSLTSALWVNAFGLLVPALAVVLVWMLTPQQAGLGADLPSALRFSAALWVSAHLIPIITSSGPISLLPLLLVVLPGLLLVRASRKATRELEISDTRESLLLTVGVALAHAIFVTLVSALISSEGLRFRPFQSFAMSLVAAMAFAGIAVFRESGAWEDLRDVIPSWFKAGVLGALVSLTILVVTAAVLLCVSVVVHRGDIASVSNSLGSGILAQVLLVVVSLLYLPTLWGWTLSALTGAGTHVGAGAILTLGAGSPNSLPPFPLLAALPDAVPSWTRILPIVVVIAASCGVISAWQRSAVGDVRTAAVVLVIAAVGLGALSLASGGSLGSGNLAHLGPHTRHAFALGFAELCLGAAIPVGLHLLKQRQR